jgi:hypothetical protein
VTLETDYLAEIALWAGEAYNQLVTGLIPATQGLQLSVTELAGLAERGAEAAELGNDWLATLDADLKTIMAAVVDPPKVDLGPLVATLGEIAGDTLCLAGDATKSRVALEHLDKYAGGHVEAIQTIASAFAMFAGLPLKDALGTAPIVGQDEQATVGGSLAQSQYDATAAVFANKPGSEGALDKLGSGIVSFVAKALPDDTPEAVVNALLAGAAAERPWQGLWNAFDKGLLGEGFKWVGKQLNLGHAGPEGVWKRAGAAYASAIGLGAVAHGISGLLSARIMGSGALNFAGLAGLVGQAAGFGPIVSAVMGNFYRAYLGVPMQYEMNRLFTPWLPQLGDVMRFRWKRLKDLPVDFWDSMSYWGFSGEWAKVYYDDMFREPMVRDLLLMAEATTCTPDWWEEKLKRLGYSDEDAPIMLEASLRRGARTQIMDLYRRLWYLAERGYMTLGRFRERCRETKLMETAVDFGAASVEVQREYRLLNSYVAKVLAMYDRDQLNDQELRDLLDVAILEPALADQEAALARIRRYRRVYLTTPEEDTRAAISMYRQLFIEGQITAAEYEAALVMAGFEPDVVVLTLRIDSARRDRTVRAEFREYDLPVLRDRLLHGLINAAQYRAALDARGFPAAYLADEVRLASSMADARRTARVRSEQVPYYERAYVIGLVSWTYLAAVLERAGLDRAAVAARRMWLEHLRAEEDRRRQRAATAAMRTISETSWGALLRWLGSLGISEEEVEAALEAGEGEEGAEAAA